MDDKILDQLFENNEARTEVDVIPDKVKASITNLNAKDQLSIEKAMSATDGSNAYILHLYSLKLLSRTVKKYNGKVFESAKEAEQFLEKLPSTLLDKLVKLQNKFEQEIRKALDMDSIDNHFFESEATPDASKQPSETLTSETEEA